MERDLIPPRPPAPSNDEAIEGLLAECLARISRGGDDPIDALCRAHPQHAEELRRRHQGLAELGLLQRPAARPAARIGAFDLLRELGRGGMGVVWLASQTTPVRRLVALKLIGTRASAQALARFDAERQTLASLVHPHIAQVLEAGTTDDGQPWYAMEFVDGQPLNAWCDGHHLDVDARLALFLQLCDAVQFAHQQGVLHRDLKPGNVLVCVRGGGPLVKVIDFGLAKALRESFAERQQLTEEGQILGTPEYMSPEQAMPTAVPVDTRADVYALGAMLYELVAGVLPFDFVALRRQGFSALQHAVCQQEPPPPSVRLQRFGEHAAAIAARAGTNPDRLLRRLRGDLDWITKKALAKDRDQRYATVAELAGDLRRHLRHEPVLAGPPGTLYVVRKLVRRHRAAVGFGTVMLTGLVGSLLVVLELWRTGQRHLESFDTLQTTVDIEALEHEAEHDLWPAIAAQVPAMDRWIGAATHLAAQLPRYHAQLVELAARGVSDGEGVRFDQPRDGYLYERLQAFLARAERFAGADGALANVIARREWAHTLRQRSVDDHAVAWGEAIATIADPQRSPLYHGLRIEPQTGLVPLGQDPVSLLYEFAVLQPGLQLPERREGRLCVAADTCIVLVLIPGGPVEVGMKVSDGDDRLPKMSHTDAEYVVTRNHPREGKRLQLELDPYFLGKYEMTQGQWLAACGSNPSDINPTTEPTVTLAHPVERVRQVDAEQTMRRLGLSLPTGVQWEHGARAGAEAPWWCGFAADGWHGAENLADQSYQRRRGPLEPGVASYEPYDDGFALHAPVDSLRPNPFGLHHVLGNVMEWTRTRYYRYVHAQPAFGDGDMVRANPDQTPLSENCEFRGGSYRFDWLASRSTRRMNQPRTSAPSAAGLRPARGLDVP